MKKILFLLSLVLSAMTFKAQSYIKTGEVQANAGLGFSGWGLPVFAGLDYGVTDDISVGGELSYRAYKEGFAGYHYTHNIIGFLVNANYHFNTVLEIPDPWDFYAGLNIGFYAWSTTSNVPYTGSGSSGLGLGLQVGGRYYFSEQIGLLLELGGGNAVSGGKIGITVKF